MRKSGYQPLGKYIEQVNVRNRDLTVTNLMGVSIEKRFIPSIANTIGTDLSPYKIVKPGQFAYGPVTSRNGDKITIALYNGNEDCIISQAYEAFRIKDTTQLLPEYLMMWAKRPEFDRYARYMSHGSVRELFSWEEMCNVMLPVPPIEEQRRIVSEYQTVERRIANNEALIQKLEETAQAIYHHTFVEGIDEENLPEGWRKGTLESECDFEYGKMPSKELLVDRGFPVYCGYEITKYYKNASHNTKTIVVIARGDAGSGEIKMSPKKFFLSNLGIAILPQDEDMKWFLYYYLKSQDTYSLRTGSAQAQVTINSLKSFDIIIPEKQVYVDFSFKIHPVSDYIDILIEENIHLRTLLSLLTSKLS